MKTTVIQARVTARERELFEKLAEQEHADSLASLIRQLLYRRIEERKKGIAA